MIAGNLAMPGGTDYVSDEYTFTLSVDAMRDHDIAVRTILIHEARMRLFAVLGAVVRRGSLLYWQVNDRFEDCVLGPAKKAFLNRRQACSLHWRRTSQEGT